MRHWLGAAVFLAGCSVPKDDAIAAAEGSTTSAFAGGSSGLATSSGAGSSSTTISDATTSSDGSTSTGVEECALGSGVEYRLEFDAPDVFTDLGAFFDVDCVRAGTTEKRARFDCDDDVGRLVVRVELPGIDMTQLPSDVHIGRQGPGFESAGFNSVLIASDAVGPLLYQVGWTAEWSAPEEWAPWWSPLAFEYVELGCPPYEPEGYTEVSCDPGLLLVSGRTSTAEVGPEAVVELEEWSIHAAWVASCQDPNNPPPLSLQFLLVHSSLLR